MPDWAGSTAPGGLLLSQLFVWDHQEVLQVFDNDLAHLPHFTVAEQLPRVPHERMSGVVVSQRKDPFCLFHHPDELLGFVERIGHRLIAHDVKAGLQKCLGDIEV